MRLSLTITSLFWLGAVLSSALVLDPAAKQVAGDAARPASDARLAKRKAHFFNKKAPLDWELRHHKFAARQTAVSTKKDIRNVVSQFTRSNGMVLDTLGRWDGEQPTADQAVMAWVKPLTDRRVGIVIRRRASDGRVLTKCTCSLLPAGYYALTARHCKMDLMENGVDVFVRMGYYLGRFSAEAHVIAAFDIKPTSGVSHAEYARRDFTVLVLDQPLGTQLGHFFIARNLYPEEEGIVYGRNIMYPNEVATGGGQQQIQQMGLNVMKGGAGDGPLQTNGGGNVGASGSALFRELNDGTEVVMGAMQGPHETSGLARFSGSFTREMDELAIVFLFAVGTYGAG